MGAGNPNWKKGVSGNPKGKPKGAISQKTRIWNDLVEYLEGQGMAKLIEHIESLEGPEYYDAYLKLLEYIRPKLQRSEVKQETVETHTITLNFGAGRAGAKSIMFPEEPTPDGELQP